MNYVTTDQLVVAGLQPSTVVRSKGGKGVIFCGFPLGTA